MMEEKEKLRWKTVDWYKVVCFGIQIAAWILFFSHGFYRKGSGFHSAHIGRMALGTALFVFLMLEPWTAAFLEKHKRAVSFAALVILPLLMFWNLETMCSSKLLKFGIEKYCLNFAIVWLMAGAILILTNRTRAALKTELVLTTARRAWPGSRSRASPKGSSRRPHIF